MVIIWEKEVAGVRHEVRKAGASLRLYTDGVFHSQFNPNYPVGGHLWDLLMLPAFYFNPESVRRILVLGSGGGAVMRQLDYFLSPEVIVGIDNNRQHHYVARQYFGIRGRPFDLIEADAVSWVSQYEGKPFDLIIDDLYTEVNGEPHRAVSPHSNWYSSLHGLLTDNGVLAINFIMLDDLLSSGWYRNKVTRNMFDSASYLSMGNYENVIGVFSRRKFDENKFLQHLQKYPEMDQRRKTSKLNYIMTHIDQGTS